jgi:hypothetical protein
MTKPNFKEMSRIELKAYVTRYRDDNEAWDAFFEKLEQERSPEAKWYPPPLDDEGVRIMEEAFREKLGLPETPRLFPEQQ